MNNEKPEKVKIIQLPESLDPNEVMREDHDNDWVHGNMKESWAKKNGFLLPDSANDNDFGRCRAGAYSERPSRRFG